MEDISVVKSVPSLPAPGSEQTMLSTAGGMGKDAVNQEVEMKKKKGKVKQRNYVLNDVGALKKKLKHENKQQEIAIGKEAKDCSNITVPMKASFFEFVKANFIQDLENNEEILKIENAEGAKAGDAYVEYSMEISFKIADSTHGVKMTAYTTTSQLMFQPIGEKAGTKAHLGQRGTPRFFVEHFIMHLSETSIKERRFNESIQTMYTSALKEEI